MKFLVIGDSCTDRFVYGSCDRLCPEAPVPVLNKEWWYGEECSKKHNFSW